MRSAKDIENIEFQKASHGYKPYDVKSYLAEVAEDYGALEREVAELRDENESQKKEISALREDQFSVHNMLMKAQKVADETIAEAKANAAAITAEANATATRIVEEAQAKVEAARREAEEARKSAEEETKNTLAGTMLKSENMLAAAGDSVARQQMAFDKLKVESAKFKRDLQRICREQLESLDKIPDEVPFDAEHAARVMDFDPASPPDFSALAASGRE